MPATKSPAKIAYIIVELINNAENSLTVIKCSINQNLVSVTDLYKIIRIRSLV
jgi:hypothetical protein